MLSRRLLFTAASIAAAAPRVARAAWPDRPIRLIVPYPPGGSSDATARILAEALSQRLGQPVVTDTRTGAGGTIGMALAAQAAPDGYTLALGNISTMVVNMAVFPNPGYDSQRDFVPLGMTAMAANLLVVNPARQLGITSLATFVEACRAKPGDLSYGTAGVGSPAHVTTVLFLKTAGIEAQHVPYRGGGPAVTDLIAGNLDFMFSFAADCLPQVQAGRLRAIAYAGARRLASLPEVQTVAEGYPGFAFENWHTVAARTGTAPDILDRLRQAMNGALQDARVQARITALGIDATPVLADDAEARVASDIARWVPMIRAAGIAVE